MATDAPRRRLGERYPLVNADEREAARLGSLQALGDPRTFRRLEALGVGPGWRCAELGAGAGSVAAWMADRVLPGGAVTAVDRDVSQLGELGELGHVTVVEADLCTLELPADAFDLVHTRSVLMHLDAPDDVVARAVRSLAPGGVVLFEETDGAPAELVTDAPEPFTRVMVPMARRWTWARGLAALLESLGMVDVHDDVREDPLVGATPVAAFWQQTLASVADLLGTEEVAAMSALLDEPDFRMPFSARHRVTARRPG